MSRRYPTSRGADGRARACARAPAPAARGLRFASALRRRPRPVTLVSGRLEILDRDGHDLVRGLEAEDLSQEREMGFERTLDVLRLSEPMALALEGDVGVRNRALLQRFDDDLRLRRRDDLVVETLQEEERP